MIYHISQRCYAAVVLVVLGPGPVHDQSPGGAVSAPVPTVGDHQPLLPPLGSSPQKLVLIRGHMRKLAKFEDEEKHTFCERIMNL